MESEQEIQRLQETRARAQTRGDQAAFASASNDLGVRLAMAGRLEEAQNELESVLSLWQGLGDAAGQARAAGNLAGVEERRGLKAQALAHYRQAADLFHEARDWETESLTRRRLSQVYFQGGDIFGALAAYTRALEVKPRRSAWDNLLLWLFRIPLGMIGGRAE